MRIVLVGSGNKEKPNIMAAAWCCPLSFDPPIFGVSIAKGRFSYELISKNKEFTINVPSEELKDVVKTCGTVSGRELNKFSKTGLTPEFGQLGAPMINECHASLECKVIEEKEVGDHIFFVGEVVNTIKRNEESKGIYQKGSELIGF